MRSRISKDNGEDSYARKRKSPSKSNLGEDDSLFSQDLNHMCFSNEFAIYMGIIMIMPLMRWVGL